MLPFKLIRQMMRTILFIVYDIVFHIERKINCFIYFYFTFLESGRDNGHLAPLVATCTLYRDFAVGFY